MPNILVSIVLVVVLWVYSGRALLLKNRNTKPLLDFKPDWLVQCHLADPELNGCLNNFTRNIFPELARGIPEIGIEPYEPLRLDAIEISKGSGPVILSGRLFNITISGPSKAVPLYTEFDLKKKRLNIGIFIPKLQIKSKYDLKGKILILPILGDGNADITIGNIRTHVKAHVRFPYANNSLIADATNHSSSTSSSLPQRPLNSKQILFITKMNLNFTIDQLHVNFANLFNGNRRLGQSLNQFINQNGQEILRELYDNVAENLALIFTDLLNRFYSKIPTELWLVNDTNR